MVAGQCSPGLGGGGGGLQAGGVPHFWQCEEGRRDWPGLPSPEESLGLRGREAVTRRSCEISARAGRARLSWLGRGGGGLALQGQGRLILIPKRGRGHGCS